MDDLVTWLRAQLNDDERIARAAGGCTWDLPAKAGYPAGHDAQLEAEEEHTARHDPARVLAEVDAKRRIMEIHNRRADIFPGNAGGTFDNCCDGCGYEGICDDPVTEDINDCPILRALALPYADRPGYRDDWRPAASR